MATRGPGWLRQVLRGRDPAPEPATMDWPAGTRIERDVPYGPHPAQRLDLYAPAAAQGCPVLVLVHGGAWMLGDKAQPGVVLHKVRHWLPRGWIVVSLNYRLLPEADPLQQAGDVARALAAVQREARRWGADGTRVALCGHSTGAHLAALVLADTALAAAHGLQPLQAAVLLDSAALDVVRVMEGPHLPLHARAFGDDPAAWRRASPWHQVQQALPPLLLVCAQDREAATQQAEHFAARARSAGGSAEVAPVALSHREINEQLGQHEELTRRVDDFLRAQGLP